MVSCNQMTYFILTLILNFFIPTSNAQSENSTQPEVTIPQGTLRGTSMITRSGRNISAFLGIPYAQPPTGNLRFRNPVPAGGWNGTRNATVDANNCLQYDVMGLFMTLGDEDCLYLNVYTPEVPQSSNASLLPVMVFIHGGSFLAWSSVSTLFGPEYILDEDVILVTINYRLGVFGFLSTGDEAAYGNYGLKDMVLSLKWIQDNVGYFGGDRDKVTIFGQSAGAAAVHLLTLSNSTNGLFHRYITESGSALTFWAHRPRAAYASRAFELGKYVGCLNDTTDSLVDCLRKTSGTVITDVQEQFDLWNGYPGIMWGPTDEPDIEGAFLTDSPINLLTAGKIRDLPWISGVVSDEGLVLTPSLMAAEGMVEDLLENFDYAIPILLGFTYQSNETSVAWTNAIKSFYFNDDLTVNNSMLFENLTNLMSDAYFVAATYRSLQLHHAYAVNSQYLYIFNYRGTYSYTDIAATREINYGVSHCDDLIYLFPSDDLYSGLNQTKSKEDHEMVDIMLKLWTSFATDGIPSISSLNHITTWDSYSTTDNYLLIGNGSDGTVEMQYSFWKERMEFWENLYKIAETSTVAPDESGSVILTPSFLPMFLIVSSVYLLSTSTVGISQ